MTFQLIVGTGETQTSSKNCFSLPPSEMSANARDPNVASYALSKCHTLHEIKLQSFSNRGISELKHQPKALNLNKQPIQAKISLFWKTLYNVHGFFIKVSFLYVWMAEKLGFEDDDTEFLLFGIIYNLISSPLEWRLSQFLKWQFFLFLFLQKISISFSKHWLFFVKEKWEFILDTHHPWLVCIQSMFDKDLKIKFGLLACLLPCL